MIYQIGDYVTRNAETIATADVAVLRFTGVQQETFKALRHEGSIYFTNDLNVVLEAWVKVVGYTPGAVEQQLQVHVHEYRSTGIPVAQEQIRTAQYVSLMRIGYDDTEARARSGTNDQDVADAANWNERLQAWENAVTADDIAKELGWA